MRAYYNINLTANGAALGTDNPDQRIADDLRDFTEMTLSLSLGLLSNVVSLGSFVIILWGLSGPLDVFGVSIPGYMVWVALAYAIVGTWLTHLVGNPLAFLRFKQQRVEADFRYALVRVRENMESIALYRGEQEEVVNLRERFVAVVANWRQIMNRTKLLNSLVVGYSQIAIIFPFGVAAPRYFSGSMQLGGLMQTVGAFGQVQDSLSWFVQSYSSLAEWRAIVERLTTFHDAIVKARAENHGGFDPAVSADGDVHLQNVTVSLPDGTKLLEGVNLLLTKGHSIVITGPIRVGQDDSVPGAVRHLAVRYRAGTNSAQLVLPATAPLRAAGHVAPCNHLSRTPWICSASKRWSRCCAMSGCRSFAIGWITTTTGRCGCRWGSSSVSVSPATYWRSRTGFSLMRPPPVSIRGPKRTCTAS